MAIQSIQAQAPSLPIVFRPHPLTHTKNNHCPELDEQLPGAIIKTDQDESLEQALQGAAVVVSISSSAAVEVCTHIHSFIRHYVVGGGAIDMDRIHVTNAMLAILHRPSSPFCEASPRSLSTTSRRATT